MGQGSKKMGQGSHESEASRLGGLAGWVWARLRPNARPRPSLALLERIPLAPRQSLALVEAEGRRFLIATSADGSPAFYALEKGPIDRGRNFRSRVSW